MRANYRIKFSKRAIEEGRRKRKRKKEYNLLILQNIDKSA